MSNCLKVFRQDGSSGKAGLLFTDVALLPTAATAHSVHQRFAAIINEYANFHSRDMT